MVLPDSYTYFVRGKVKHPDGEIHCVAGVDTINRRIETTQDVEKLIYSLLVNSELSVGEIYSIDDFKLVSENLPLCIESVYHLSVKGLDKSGNTLVVFDVMYRVPIDHELNHNEIAKHVLKIARKYNETIDDVSINSMSHLRDERQ